MKSRAKVISQKHIREIPVGMYGNKGFGIMSHGIDSDISKSKSPSRTKRRIQSQSRRINRVK